MAILGLAITVDCPPRHKEPLFRDEGAALIVEGVAVSAMDRIKLEKRSKKKASLSFPVVRFVLTYYGIKLSDVDQFALLVNHQQVKGNDDLEESSSPHINSKIIGQLQKEFNLHLNHREFIWVKPHWAYALNGLTLAGHEAGLCVSVHEQERSASLAILKVDKNAMDELDFFSRQEPGEFPVKEVMKCLILHQKNTRQSALCITGNRPLPPVLEEEIRLAGGFRDIFSHPMENAAGWARGAGLYLYRQELSTRKNTEIIYESYRNETERILTEVWQQVLKKEKISIHDDFFQLGGNSMTVIQAAAKLKAYGLELNIKDLYLYPNIKELAKNVKENKRIIDQGPVEGEVELTPMQGWFFSNRFTDRHHFNQAVMLYNERRFDEALLKKVFTKIVEYHDALRMIFEEKGKRITRRNRNPQEGKLFDMEIIHLDETGGDMGKKIEIEADRIQASIDLARGPLVKLGLFKTSQGDYLLIVIHHLVVDGISWRILLEDISTAYRQLSRGKEIKFPDKTDSFKYWAQELKEYASGKEVLKDLEYWKNIESTKRELLPRDHEIPGEKKKYKYLEHMSLELNTRETRDLVEKVNRSYNTGINDILLTALGLAIKEWAGIDHVLINLEGHGREAIFAGEILDINRTVGWFTAQYPIILDIKKTGGLSHHIKSVKETLSNIPNKGITYGILRYLTPAGKKAGTVFTLEPEICFNYLGDFHRHIDVSPGSGKGPGNDAGFIQISGMSCGKNVSPGFEKLYAIDIGGMIMEGKLTLSFAYNRLEYNKYTIEKLLTAFKSYLLKIIEHCLQQENE